MKVLSVLASDKFSGAENVVCQIIGMFNDSTQFEFAYCSPDGDIKDALAERNIKFYPVKSLDKSELLRVIDEFKPDVIHAHDMRASFVAARACKKIPLISHIHNNAFDSRGISVKSIAYILAGIKAKHIFWVSQSAFKGYFFHGLFKKKSSVLYNVIDVDALYEKMQKDEKTYSYDAIFLGRLTYPKNPQRMLDVFKRVVELKPDARLAIVGTGELDAEVKEYCKSLKLESNVEFLGFQSNPYKILHDSKVMLMTSRWEGLPMCALEALSLKVPIVSTPTDGLKDLIVDNENGFLSEDDEVLAKNIYEIITDGEKRKMLSDNAYKRAQELNDVNAYKGKLMEQYK